MPYLAAKPCAKPGCGALVTSGRYCVAHTQCQGEAKALYDATARKQDPALAMAARIRNSGRWKGFRRWFIVRHPLCCDPFAAHGQAGALADQVHHVRGLASHPELAFEEENCRSLCTSCHSRVEGLERRGTGTAGLFDGLGKTTQSNCKSVKNV